VAPTPRKYLCNACVILPAAVHLLALKQRGFAQCRIDVKSVEIPKVFVFFQKDVELKGLS
jgi:hypothetical protein